MSTEQIVVLLTEERDRLNRAIEILGGTRKRRGRPPGKKAASTESTRSVSVPTESATVGPKKRKMSAGARKRISDAQKKRWAAAKNN